MSQHKNTTNLLQLNTTGLSKHKIVALNKYLDNTNAHIAALAETHRIISDEEFPEYEIAQSCIEGGASLLIHKSLPCSEVLDLKTKDIDAVLCITQLERCPILVGSVYIPPNKETKLKKFLKDLKKVKNTVEQTKSTVFWFLGTTTPDTQCGKTIKSTNMGNYWKTM